MNRRISMAAALALLCLAAAPATPPVSNAAAERAASARRAYELASSRYSTGAGVLNDVAEWSLRWAEADPGEGKRGHLERRAGLLEQVQSRYEAGTVGAIDVAAATYWRADAEIRAGAK